MAIFRWLVVLTILNNISQWEGLSHILWKIKAMFEITNQIKWGTPFFHPFLMACSIIKHSSGQIIVIDKPETKLYWENFPY